MIGTSALWFDLDEKLEFIKQTPHLKLLEYGIDNLEDLDFFISKTKNQQLDKGFHLPLKTNPIEDIKILRDANLYYVEQIVREALKLKPLYFNMHLGYVFLWKLAQKRDYYIDLACEYLNHLLKLDEEFTLYIENVYTFIKKKSGDLSSFGCYERDFLEIIEKVGSDRLKFCHDTGHSMIQKTSFDKSPLISSSLLHLNFNDSTLDEHLGIYILGDEGKNYYNSILENKLYEHIIFEMPLNELQKSISFLNS